MIKKKGSEKVVMKKEWSSCPYDKKKLLMIDSNKSIEGVYIKCPTCKREIEIINKPRGQTPEPLRSESRTLELVSSYI